MTRQEQDGLGASAADAADRVTDAPHEAGKPSSPSGSVPTGAEIAAVLNAAADLIEPKGAWTKKVAGRDAHGVPLTIGQLERAVCFCMTGAIWRAARGSAVRPIEDAFPVVRKAVSAPALGTWNDHPRRKQASVVAALRQAAALAATPNERADQ